MVLRSGPGVGPLRTRGGSMVDQRGQGPGRGTGDGLAPTCDPADEPGPGDVEHQDDGQPPAGAA